MPTSIAPRLPPPAKTNAVDGIKVGGTIGLRDVGAAPGIGAVNSDDGPGRPYQVLMKTLPGGARLAVWPT
ncbi:hypothetical protein [Burkholderia sp. Ac-20353]|uniref:hypothetical protein n=1 Tax=Burkholderia sp. Ac-20353 TaxID=2703894 RepID=UPI001F11C365|nr:hypothetical protein [Burkholderia sp. Ac-20353]